ncbi:cupin domain-containing protein [Rhizobium sp. P44RR-XXIV]|uniref:cupin domain-containing protein n=1 Tax=Rhizobium sp. P44RR-XXIV TaxID=1921145 RepID=UPI001FED6F5A|nr:cupin domain-containing protein [Rhizobium sp. P44RR-XXIV]
MELRVGDYVLSSRPMADVFLSEPTAKTVLSDEAFKAIHSVDGEVRLGNPLDEPATRIVGGLIVCDPANAHLLVELLPRCIHLRAEDEAAARLHTLVSIVREEADETRPGRNAVLSRLIEVMLIETLRREVASSLPHRGVLGGLADTRLAKRSPTSMPMSPGDGPSKSWRDRPACRGPHLRGGFPRPWVRRQWSIC